MHLDNGSCARSLGIHYNSIKLVHTSEVASTEWVQHINIESLQILTGSSHLNTQEKG